jgi:cytoskeletal protein RodZ
MRSLKAIECGEFKKLPGGIYNTSYIRQYAKAIDFDESELLAFYAAATGSATSTGNSAGSNKDTDSGGFSGGLRIASILR